MAEVAASSFVVIFMVILSLDVWMLITAAQVNDSACRDAARAAAQGNDNTTAANLAYTALAAHKQVASMFIQSPAITGWNFQDYTGQGVTIPANSTPFVTVTTTCQVHPIIPLSVFGTMIINTGSVVTFTQTYTFPLVKSKALPQ